MKKIDTPVYVVDDDASVREAVESLIRSAGFPVRTFGSAQEFLATPRADMPSCLVLDLHLPGLSGLDLQRELAKDDVQIPIIFLTGHGDIPTSVKAIKAGALEFLTKPFHDEDLLNAIRDGIAQDPRLRAAPNPDGVIGSSRLWRQALAYAAKVAATEATVLLKRYSSPSYSAMRRGPSPAPSARVPAGSSRRRAARCSSMKSEK